MGHFGGASHGQTLPQIARKSAFRGIGGVSVSTRARRATLARGAVRVSALAICIAPSDRLRPRDLKTTLFVRVKNVVKLRRRITCERGVGGLVFICIIITCIVLMRVYIWFQFALFIWIAHSGGTPLAAIQLLLAVFQPQQ